MTISLITVTYNSKETLINTIHSVRQQKYPDLEYIIVDGGSTDDTVGLIKSNSDIITKWLSEPDSGIYDAMNKGLKMATGDLIGFLHADDKFASADVLRKVAINIKDNHLLYGDLQYVSSNYQKVIRNWESGCFSIDKLQKGWMPPHPTVYFRRELVEEYGNFDSSYSISADYEWLLRVLKQPSVRVCYLPHVLVKMSLGGASNRSLKNLIKKSREDYRAIKIHKLGGLRTLLYKNVSKLDQFF